MAWSYDKRAYIEWNISSLAGAALTANPVYKYEGSVDKTVDEEINPIIEEAPAGASDADLYGYIASGTAYVDPWAFAVGANQSADLGASAKSDLQDAIDALRSWFAIGLQDPGREGAEDDYITKTYSDEKTDAPNPKPTLYVEYSPPVVEKKHTFRLHPRPGHRMEFHPNLKLG